MRLAWIVLGLVALALGGVGCSSEDGAPSAPPTDWYSPPPSPIDQGAPAIPAFYTQRVDVGGIPIVASSAVDRVALEEAAYLTKEVTAHRPSLTDRIAASNVRFSIVASTEQFTDLPEYRSYWPQRWWNWRDRGVGSTSTNPVMVAPEENLLAFMGDTGDGYSVFVHELGHVIEDAMGEDFQNRIVGAYTDAVNAGRFTGTYAATNPREYWAQGTSSWFGANPEYIATRDELRTYDAELADLLEEVYGDAPWRWTSPRMRTGKDHLDGFDPSAHTFTMPEYYDPIDDTNVSRIPLLSGEPPTDTPSGIDYVFVFFANQTSDTVGIDRITNGQREHYAWYLPNAMTAFPFGVPGTVGLLKKADGTALSSFVVRENGKIVLEP